MRLRRLLSSMVLAYPRITLTLSLVLTLLSVQVAIGRLSFTSTHEALAPLKGRLGEVQKRYHQAFGDPDQAVIVIESDDQHRAKRFAATLARRLRARVPEVEEVIDRFNLTSLENHFLLYLSPRELADLKRKLQEHQALLEALSAEPGLNRLFQLIHRETSKALVGHLFTGFLEEEEGEAQRPLDLVPLITLLEQLNEWTERPRAYISPWSTFFAGAHKDDDREGYLWSDDKR
ncbi:MAG: hypothetical protein HYY12_00305, partial [Candidatus Methylomirabilis oxyfera]|nr:hypothetical protein [Candidatus Methylomirabilis oxyfera]